MRLINFTNGKITVRSCGIFCAALLLLAGSAPESHAVIDGFNSGLGDHLVIQGENFTTNVINAGTYPVDHPNAGDPIDAGWEVISEPGAAGGQALRAQTKVSGGGPADSAHHAGTASYDVRFNATGIYKMYLRASFYDVIAVNRDSGGVVVKPFVLGDSDDNYGNEDSFYFPAGGTSSLNGTGAFVLASASPASNGNNYDRIWSNGPGTADANVGIPTEGTFDWWIKQGPNWAAGGPPNRPVFNVKAADEGIVLNYTLDTREAGIAIDTIIFSTNLDLTPSQLNALAGVGVPEPSSLALIGLGMASLMNVRKRRRS